MPVPFVGCESGGQTEIKPAPGPRGPVAVHVGVAEAARLAYYESADGLGVLAPRGWECTGTSGSGGYGIWVGPPTSKPGSSRDEEGEYSVTLVARDKPYEVAELIGRAFPQHLGVAKKFWEIWFSLGEAAMPIEPFPADRIRRRNDRVVEFTTAAGQEGLGNRFYRRAKGGAVDGMLKLLMDPRKGWAFELLSLRLPKHLQWLGKAVVEDASVAQRFQGGNNWGMVQLEEEQVTIPFVGCPSVGREGYLPAPAKADVAVPILAEDAAKLAYYQAERSEGVLAPRGWHCFGRYGSGGSSIWVSPRRVPQERWMEPRDSDLEGPMVSLLARVHPLQVAEFMARLFPAFLPTAQAIWKSWPEPKKPLPVGPLGRDTLSYHSERVVDYLTPAGAVGLGTAFGLKPGEEIEGVGVLWGGQGPEKHWEYRHLSVRLPGEEYGPLKKWIVQEVVREKK